MNSAITSGSTTSEKNPIVQSDDVARGDDDEEPPRPGGRQVHAVGHLRAGEVGGARRGSPAPRARRLRAAARRGPGPSAAAKRSESCARTAPRTSPARVAPPAHASASRRPGRGPVLLGEARVVARLVGGAHRASVCVGSRPDHPRSAQALEQPVRRLGVPLGQQPGRRQDVVAVDGDPRVLGDLPAAGGRHVVERDASAAVRVAWRSTPPEPTSSATSRRSVPLRSTNRPPAASYRTWARPGVPPQRHPDRGRGQGDVEARTRRRRRGGRPGRRGAARPARAGPRCRRGSPAPTASSTVETALHRIPRSPSTVRFAGGTATTSRREPGPSDSSTGSTTE